MSNKKFVIGFLVCISLLFSVPPAMALSLNLFGDATFGDSSKSGDVAGFSLGQLDLWATQKIDREGKMKGFVEFVIESPGGGFVVDLERIWVSYNQNIGPVAAQVRAGRFHTSLGYWNRVHHHGAHMQTSVFRPLFLDFEDGDTAILPTHIIGIMGIADLDLGLGILHLELQVGNGSYYDGGELNPNNAGDVDQDKGIATRIVFSPAAIEGLGGGFSLYVNPTSMDDGTGSGAVIDLVNQRIYVVDLSYVENNIEFIFEHYWISNEDKRTGFSQTTRTSTAWYVQGGYTFFEAVTPYVRHENFENMSVADPYFATLGSSEYSQTVVGTRFDIVQNSSVKLEGRFVQEPAAMGGSSQSYWMQWTFGF